MLLYPRVLVDGGLRAHHRRFLPEARHAVLLHSHLRAGRRVPHAVRLIAGNGLSLLVSEKVDFNENRNLMIVASSLIVGIGMMTTGVSVPLGSFEIPGLLLAAILSVVLNLVLPKEKEELVQC